MGAVLTFLHVRAAEVLRILGEIILASFFRNSVKIGVFVYIGRVSAVAVTAPSTVDENLGGEGDIRPRSVSGDVDPIGDGAGGALGPATSAVVRHVLIFVPGEVVDSADVSPVPVLGEVLDVQVLVGARTSHEFGDGLRRLSSAF